MKEKRLTPNPNAIVKKRLTKKEAGQVHKKNQDEKSEWERTPEVEDLVHVQPKVKPKTRYVTKKK